MNLIFLGTPEFAIPSLEELLQTPWVKVLAVCTQTDKEAGRGKELKEPPIKKLALKKNITLLQTEKISKDLSVIQKIKDLNPDILITCAFGQILSEELLNLAPLGAINVHASLLPKYRGAAPINWAILNGETETGITIMQTELGLDSGPIILQEKCKIDENETSIELFQKLSLLGARTLICALEEIKNKKAKFIPQDTSLATKAPSLKKELGLINWNKTSKEIHNKIRGLQPWPSAFTHLNRKIIKIWDSRDIACNVSLMPKGNTPPGTIVEISDYVKVKTGDGFLNIYKLQPENKKIINVKDWINGTRVKTGDKFE
ncbi:MAG: methionyl-tRNA formyltransferase [Candidatus Melainabacteria bacterium]|nr:methionyl-tRNA formyltransferase [Candidatus Melainabacteria bacterium]